MRLKYGAAIMVSAMAFIQPASAGSFDDYGGLGKYRRSLAEGGGCISGMIGTTIQGKNFNTLVNFAAYRYTEKAVFNKAYFGFTTLNKKHDIIDGPLRASAFMMCLEPGDYNITGIELQQMTSKVPIRMPFTVIAGKNLYLGRLIFSQDLVHNLNCSGLPTQFGVEIQNTFDQDLGFIMNRKGAIVPEPWILDAEQGSPYFFSCPNR
jgi:hypothetical protein